MNSDQNILNCFNLKEKETRKRMEKIMFPINHCKWQLFYLGYVFCGQLDVYIWWLSILAHVAESWMSNVVQRIQCQYDNIWQCILRIKENREWNQTGADVISFSWNMHCLNCSQNGLPYKWLVFNLWHQSSQAQSVAKPISACRIYLSANIYLTLWIEISTT